MTTLRMFFTGGEDVRPGTTVPFLAMTVAPVCVGTVTAVAHGAPLSPAYFWLTLAGAAVVPVAAALGTRLFGYRPLTIRDLLEGGKASSGTAAAVRALGGLFACALAVLLLGALSLFAGKDVLLAAAAALLSAAGYAVLQRRVFGGRFLAALSFGGLLPFIASVVQAGTLRPWIFAALLPGIPLVLSVLGFHGPAAYRFRLPEDPAFERVRAAARYRALLAFTYASVLFACLVERELLLLLVFTTLPLAARSVLFYARAGGAGRGEMPALSLYLVLNLIFVFVRLARAVPDPLWITVGALVVVTAMGGAFRELAASAPLAAERNAHESTGTDLSPEPARRGEEPLSPAARG